MVEVALVRRELVALPAVRQAVADAYRDLVELGQNVQLRERERREAVHAGGEAQSDEVEPATAPLAACGRPVLAAKLAHAALRVAFDLGRERAFADARDVSLGDAEDLVDPRRSDAGSRRGCAGR